MSSPATVTEYGKFIDLQNFLGTAPARSGSIYLSGSDAAEKLHTNVGISSAGSVTAVGSFIIGSADMSEADLEKLDGITNGTVAADKAVVVDSNKDASGFRHVTSTGNVTAGGSFIIGSADMDETDLEKLDGITNGTVAANKAVVVDGNKDASGFRNVTAEGSFIIGSADMDETDLEKLDGITNGTAAASKAVVLDASKDVTGIRDMGMRTASGSGDVTFLGSAVLGQNVDLGGDLTAGTITMTGFTVDADGDTALKSLLVDDSSTIGCDSDTDLMSLADGALTVNGTLSADTSFTLDAVSVNATELGFIDGVTAGTAAASKALVLDASKNIGSINQLTASHAKIDVLDVNTINSVTTTASDLEVSDRRIVSALSASSANADGGGLRIGGGADTAGHASVLYDHGNTALDFNIGGTTEIRLQDGVLRPETNNDVDLGAAAAQYKNLYIDGQAFIDQLGEALDANSQNITGVGTFSAGGATVTSLSVTDGNITNVADIALDSISADGNDIDLVLTDNREAALEIKEGSDVYLQFDTSNGQEAIFAKKEFEFQAGANMDDNQKFKFGTDESDMGASGSLGYVAASDVFEISGSGANGIRMSGSLSLTGGGGAEYGIEAGASSFTSLDLNEGNITNVGSLACDSIAVDAAGVGLDIQFGGNTTLNKLTLTDNLADALNINEGGNSYLKFVTTDGQEEMVAGKELTLSQGALVSDDQAVVFGDDDDGSIAFISAANVVRFDGGSSGLHFNDTSVFGADGSGKDVSLHGAAANELLKYTAADHQLKFVDSSGADHLTLGGDADSEFAIDVADGSANKNKVRAAAFVTYSDERLKTDVAPMQNGLETVNNLKAVNFTWKKDGSRDFGFMAQQLKQVVPQAVHGSEEGLYGVDYGRLSAILVSAIQEQSVQIASLKKQLENK